MSLSRHLKRLHVDLAHCEFGELFIGRALFIERLLQKVFSLSVAELGPLTGNGSGLLNMAIVGGAVLPVIQGAIADGFGLHHAFVLPVICYLYILFYAASGSKPSSARYARA